jgi:large subunit ribosomal protein L25
MSEKLVAQSKGNDGKLAVNAKRKKGFIPVNLYGPGIENSHSYYIDELALNRAIKSGKKIHEITSDVGDFKIVMKEVQRHPVTWKLVHVDMLSLKPGMRVTVTVPLRFEGVPYGVKNMGGVFIINSRDITVEAMAEYIPNEITLDVSPLKLKDTIHASDVKRENIKVVSPAEMLLARVGITRAAVSAAEATTTPAAAAPAPAAGGAAKPAAAAPAAAAAKPAAAKPAAKK